MENTKRNFRRLVGSGSFVEEQEDDHLVGPELVLFFGLKRTPINIVSLLGYFLKG
jgi:hypothetical protein